MIWLYIHSLSESNILPITTYDILQLYGVIHLYTIYKLTHQSSFTQHGVSRSMDIRTLDSSVQDQYSNNIHTSMYLLDGGVSPFF